jgi:hypothetical protein
VAEGLNASNDVVTGDFAEPLPREFVSWQAPGSSPEPDCGSAPYSAGA